MSFVCLQLQRLIHLLFENLSSILEPLLMMDHMVDSEGVICSVNDLVPSLQKLRKLEGILTLCYII